MNVKTNRPAEKHRRSRGRRPAVEERQTTQPRVISPAEIWAAACAAGLLAAFVAYWPSLHGEFIFDDAHMQFLMPHAEQLPIRAWLAGSRPLTGLSYWINYQIGGTDTLSYHVLSLLMHAAAALMVYFIVRKILELASIDSRRGILVSGFCAGLFLLHPLQTEAVAYISSRSENLSVAFAYGAWAVFLYRRSSAIGIGMTLAVLALYGAALGGKEHVAVLPAVLLLTDYYWNPGFSFRGIWRNWRLYATLAVLGSVFGALLISYLAHERTAGFNMKEFTWYQYFFTQCRVIFIYLRLFLFPAGQNADYDLALSHTPFEGGAIVAMAALAAAAIFAFVWRKRFPIASFGFFVALIFFLPTSSFVPIRDLIAERRMYLPMIGFLLMASEILVRIRWNERVLAGAMATVLAIAAVLTWNRSQVWASSMALWSDTVEKSPNKARARLGLAAADFEAHRNADAIVQYQAADRLNPGNDSIFYANWAAALEGAGRQKEALEMGRKAVAMSPSASNYDALGRIVALNGDVPRALELLDKGEKSDPGYVPVYIDRGDILMAIDRNAEACAAFQKARSIDPQNQSALRGLTTLRCPGAN